MKKSFLYTLFGLLVFASGVFGQEFPKTYTATSCLNCIPPGYTIVSGGPVALSNMTGVGGSPLKDWVNGFSNPPSSNKAIDANTGNVFLTLQYGPTQKDKVRAYVGTGFEVGIKYTLHYYVMTSRAHLTAATISDYATSATLEVIEKNAQGNSVPIAAKVTSFTPGANVDSWIEQTVTFVAPKTDLYFQLSSSGSLQNVSYVNFDIYSKPFDCVVPGGQAELIRSNLSTLFTCSTTDLYAQIKSATPTNSTPVWSTVATHGFTQMTYAEAANAAASLAGEDYYLFYKSANGCYNTDISSAKVTFTATPTQVSLSSNEKSINCINQTSVDLGAQLTPTNYKVHWFKNDKHQGLPFDNPQAAPVGTYYAFYFDSKNNCYSVDKAAISSIFQVLGSTMCCNDPNDPSNEVPLLQTEVKIAAPALTYNLTQLVPSNISLPPNVVLEWYTSANHTGSPIADPKHVGAGKYYVFAHDTLNGCFNMAQSKTGVTVSKACYAGNTPVALVDISNEFFCQGSQVVLNDFVASAPPSGLSVVWFDNNTHSGSPITTGEIDNGNDAGNYYAYYYDAPNQCYSPSSSIYLKSKQTTINCGEDGCELSVACPPVGVNLNALHIGQVPAGWELRWFNNTTHSGEKVANPTSVTQAGEYYSFYYNVAKQCYNKTGLQNGGNDISNKKVTVTSQACANGPKLDVRVVLQGARVSGSGDDVMHNNLQVYNGNGNPGLLPTTSPYGDLAICPDISNLAKMSGVTDWIKVEIRDAIDPSILLESKSLILWASGLIGNLDGTSQPIFTSQPKPVRIVIKHRNHLAVMSNPIQNFSSGIVSYDFTTALSQASSSPGDPPQMVQKNGMWCMWMGDMAAGQDLVIDATDVTWLYNANKVAPGDTYIESDLNLDGVVDASDVSLLYFNNLKAPYSSLSNY